VEILWWLAPAAVVTFVTMLWVTWRGRTVRAADREAAARRLGEVLGRERRRHGYAAPRRTPGRTTGVAVRRTSQRTEPGDAPDRQAS
jgi:hypothetical protein